MTQRHDKAEVLRMAVRLETATAHAVDDQPIRMEISPASLDQAADMLRAYAEVVEVDDAMAYKVGDEYFRLCKESGDKPMPHAFWSAHLRAALTAALSTRGGDNG